MLTSTEAATAMTSSVVFFMQFLPFVPRKCQACSGRGGGEGDRERGSNVNDRDGTSSLWLSRFLSAALTFEKRTKTEDSLHCSEGGEEEGEGKRETEGEVEGLVESELELQVNSLFSWANVTTLQQIEVSLPTPPVDNALSSQLPTGPPSLLPLIVSPS